MCHQFKSQSLLINNTTRIKHKYTSIEKSTSGQTYDINVKYQGFNHKSLIQRVIFA